MILHIIVNGVVMPDERVISLVWSQWCIVVSFIHNNGVGDLPDCNLTADYARKYRATRNWVKQGEKMEGKGDAPMAVL